MLGPPWGTSLSLIPSILSPCRLNFWLTCHCRPLPRSPRTPWQASKPQSEMAPRGSRACVFPSGRALLCRADLAFACEIRPVASPRTFCYRSKRTLNLTGRACEPRRRRSHVPRPLSWTDYGRERPHPGEAGMSLTPFFCVCYLILASSHALPGA